MDCGESLSRTRQPPTIETLSSHLCWMSISQLLRPTVSSTRLSMRVTIHRAWQLHHQMFRVYVSGNTSPIEPT
jgi:hypothetical protein